MRSLPALTLMLLAAGCATVPPEAAGPDPKLTEALAGKVAGESRRCIPVREASSGEYFREAIVYRQNRARLWISEMRGCPLKYRSDYILVIDVRSSQVCTGDLVRLVERTGGFGAGACTFGAFTEYRTPKS
ncbi:MAG: hypothetical protein ACKVOP_06855 [Sphingomonadaceae bacterium]